MIANWQSLYPIKHKLYFILAQLPPEVPQSDFCDTNKSNKVGKEKRAKNS